jgi:hypothetical protein
MGDTKELLDCGIKFYDMGYASCLNDLSKLGKLGKSMKLEALRKFIKQELEINFINIKLKKYDPESSKNIIADILNIPEKALIKDVE